MLLLAYLIQSADTAL